MPVGSAFPYAMAARRAVRFFALAMNAGALAATSLGSAVNAQSFDDFEQSGVEAPQSSPAGQTPPVAPPTAGHTHRTGPVPPGRVFRDCAGCPELVSIPAGSFTMGSPESEPGRFRQESPQHVVEVGRFALGRYEVTIEQWDTCVSAGGCSPRPDAGWRGNDTPVTHVSWNDAQRYVQWLSRRSGHAYRLPSEAEWEYAARAGSSTARHWGDEIGTGNANCDGCGSPWDNRIPAPVGSLAANDFGLYDMLGNVWEWTQDCWNDSYGGAPTDGSAWQTGDCYRRLVRGGSWNFRPAVVRSAVRFWVETKIRHEGVGFRVARSF